MIDEIKHIPITFNAEWFESCYSVYVLTIKKSSDEIYYYIGQTGDRKHISARSPFYRLMGHYSPYQGTDTQLVQGLIKHNLIENKEGQSLRVSLETAFSNNHIEVKADYFKITAFDGTTHTDKRILVEQVEQLLIDHFKKQNKELFNKIEPKSIENARKNNEAVIVAASIMNRLDNK